MVPRGLAVQVLTAVLSDGEPLDLALERVSEKNKLDSQARAWLLDVSAGVMRWKGRLDLAIDSTALKKKPSGWLRKVMLVGAYQLLLQERVAPAVVVSETVSEVKRKEGEAPAKFVNASLRKVADTAREWRELPFPEGAKASEQASWASLPEWFWKRLIEQHGIEWARAFAQAALERPTLWLRYKSLKEQSSAPVPGAFRSDEGGAVTEKAGFSEGDFFVQDISSQLLVHEISTHVRESLGADHLSALDLCAAPGGKALGLAWNGFQVSATDVDQGRLGLLQENIRRMRSDVSVISRNQVATLAPQDLVWVDAPCTGSGIIRRHPDVRWLRKEKDLASLTERQLALVKEAWEKVRPGGFLAYSVCSVFKEEGPGIAKRAGLDSQIVKQWRLAPHEAPFGDGFWAAVFCKPRAR